MAHITPHSEGNVLRLQHPKQAKIALPAFAITVIPGMCRKNTLVIILQKLEKVNVKLGYIGLFIARRGDYSQLVSSSRKQLVWLIPPVTSAVSRRLPPGKWFILQRVTTCCYYFSNRS